MAEIEVPLSLRRPERWSRREFVCRLTGAVTAGLVGARPHVVAAEPPPETTQITLVEIPGICIAPQYVAKDLLHSEGFTDVQYVQAAAGIETAKALAAGKADISLNFVALMILQMDAGDPIVLLAGIHVGCFVLFGTERVRAGRDLKGKTVGVQALGSSVSTSSWRACWHISASTQTRMSPG